MDEAPARLCCGQRHWAPPCPDGKTMCCLCFDRFEPEDLHRDAAGQIWDVCIACQQNEERLMEE